MNESGRVSHVPHGGAAPGGAPAGHALDPAPCRALEPARLPGPVLAIDTSATLDVALVRPDGPAVRGHEAAPRRHAERLAPLIAQCLAEAGLAIADLAAVAVGTGPAAFTGLRVGLMTAQALALPAGLPVWGVPSLDATAVAWARRAEPAVGERVVVVRDAKRRELFHAGYLVTDGGLARVSGPAVGPAADIAASAAGSSVIGDLDVAGQYGLDVAAFEAAEPDGGVDAALLALIGAERAARGEALPAEPLYLRRPDVQPPTGAKRASR